MNEARYDADRVHKVIGHRRLHGARADWRRAVVSVRLRQPVQREGQAGVGRQMDTKTFRLSSILRLDTGTWCEMAASGGWHRSIDTDGQ